MPDDPPAHDPQDDLYKQSPLYRELSSWYDDPDSFFDHDLPFIHHLRIVRSDLPSRPDVLRIEIEGLNLMLHLREAFLGMVKKYSESQLLAEYGTSDWNTVRDQIIADDEYLKMERRMYLLFARNVPNLMVKLYNALLGLSVFSAVRKELDQHERDETEEAMRALITATVRDIETDLKGMLEVRSAGRPLGSTKSPEQRAEEAKEFTNQIEAAIIGLSTAQGSALTKTAVAKALGLGGLSARTGVDSSLNVFNNKLKRLGIDYDTIVEKVNK